MTGDGAYPRPNVCTGSRKLLREYSKRFLAMWIRIIEERCGVYGSDPREDILCNGCLGAVDELTTVVYYDYKWSSSGPDKVAVMGTVQRVSVQIQL